MTSVARLLQLPLSDSTTELYSLFDGLDNLIVVYDDSGWVRRAVAIKPALFTALYPNTRCPVRHCVNLVDVQNLQ